MPELKNSVLNKTSRKNWPQFKIVLASVVGVLLCGLLAFDIVKNLIAQKSENSNIIQNQADICQHDFLADKQKCWDETLDHILQTQSLDLAFDFVNQIFNSDPDFSADCHHYVHKLGEKAYELYSKNENFIFTSKTTYCGYGFFHGFMSKQVLDKVPPEKIRDFCDYLSKQSNREPQHTVTACLHGFGHGAVEDQPHPLLWGKPQEIIKPALNLCEKIARSESEIYACSSGIFNGLEVLMTSEKYKLKVDRDDPFSICRIQPKKYQRGCFTQMVVAAILVSGHDFSSASKFVLTIEDNDIALETMANLFIERTRMETLSNDQKIRECRDLPEKFHQRCIQALAEGFLKYGPPEHEYVKTISFCNLPELNTDEKKACFKRILSILRVWYTKEKSVEICNMVDPQYRSRTCEYK